MVFIFWGVDHIDLMFLPIYGVFLCVLYNSLHANGCVMWLLVKGSTFDLIQLSVFIFWFLKD